MPRHFITENVRYHVINDGCRKVGEDEKVLNASFLFYTVHEGRTIDYCGALNLFYLCHISYFNWTSIVFY